LIPKVPHLIPNAPVPPRKDAVENSDLTHQTTNDAVPLARLAREDSTKKGADDMVPEDSAKGEQRKSKRRPKRKTQFGDDDDKEDQAQSGAGGGGGMVIPPAPIPL
jgi:hypothetical protein